jgi:RNA polymerase sigma-70 factor (ECF subfamily)
METTSEDWKRIVERALDGDRHAFDLIVRQYARLVYSQVYAILQDHQETEDVVQDTFVKAYNYRKNLRDPGTIRSWLLSISRNLSRDILRKRHRALLRADLLSEDIPDGRCRRPGWALDREERSEQLTAALAGLPEHYRTALTLRYLAGLDHRSIEKQMGISNGKLRGILGRALMGLRRQMRNGGE